MGRDIYVHTEFLMNGRWEHGTNYYDTERWGLFYDQLQLLSKTKPVDLNPATQYALEEDEGKDVGCIGREECEQLRVWLVERKKMMESLVNSTMFRPLYSNFVQDVLHNDIFNLPRTIEDCRIVFWFTW